jgi:hypothetical protein
MKADDRKAIAFIAGLVLAVGLTAALVDLIGGLVAFAALAWVSKMAVVSIAKWPGRRQAFKKERIRAAKERAIHQANHENKLLMELSLPCTEESRAIVRSWQEYLRKAPLQESKSREQALNALRRAGFEKEAARSLREANEALERRYGLGSFIKENDKTAFLLWRENCSRGNQ